MTKVMSMDVISRFLKGTELEKFLKDYQDNKKGLGNQNRFIALKTPVTPLEKEMVKDYLSNENESVRTADLAKKFNSTLAAFPQRVMRIALKMLYQKITL